MAHETMIVNAYGEPTTQSQLLDMDYLNRLTSEQKEALAYEAKELKKPLKNVDEMVKHHLENGGQFKHISYSKTNRAAVDQSEETKKEFVKKYGWAAVSVNTPAQLKREFGKAIEQDLEKVTVYSEQNRIKYE